MNIHFHHKTELVFVDLLRINITIGLERPYTVFIQTAVSKTTLDVCGWKLTIFHIDQQVPRICKTGYEKNKSAYLYLKNMGRNRKWCARQFITLYKNGKKQEMQSIIDRSTP